MKYMIIEIPHQRPPCVWEAENDDRIIEIANAEHDFYYTKWTTEEAVEAFDADDFPENLKAILDEHGVAMQVGHSGETEWYSVDEVGTEFEEAKEAIAHDLHSCHFMPHGEAQEWADNYSRHQALEVRKAIRKLLS